MKLLWIAAITTMAAFSVIAAAADLSGAWKGSMETQMGDTEVTIAVRPGPAFAGTVKLGEYEGAIEKAKVDGAKVDFEVNVGPGKVTFRGTWSGGDELKFNVTGTQGNTYSLVCKRQK